MSLNTLFENAQTLSSGLGAVLLYYARRKSRVMHGVIYVYGVLLISSVGRVVTIRGFRRPIKSNFIKTNYIIRSLAFAREKKPSSTFRIREIYHA